MHPFVHHVARASSSAFLGLLVAFLLPASSALAVEGSATVELANPLVDGLYVEYGIEGSVLGIQGVCLILEDEATDGFYQQPPASGNGVWTACLPELEGHYNFTGLKSDTRYWLSAYPYEYRDGKKWLTGGGIAGREIRTRKPAEYFPATASQITAFSVKLSTPRTVVGDEYYFASCSPYTGVEESDGFTRVNSMVVGSLKPDTTYTCRIYIVMSPTGGVVEGQSVDVVFKTSAAEQARSSKATSSRPRSGNVPPAGYEDEVLVDFSGYENPFPDTEMNGLSGRAAAELYRRAVIGGFPDGEFKGKRPVNRAEAAKFLLLARYGSVADVENNGRFTDVLDGQWYTKYVVTAADKAIISGHPDGTFRPADEINVAEFLKMITLTFDLQTDLDYHYEDVAYGEWYSQYAGVGQQYEMFPVYRTWLYPDRKLSRSDVAVAIYQYLRNR